MYNVVDPGSPTKKEYVNTLLKRLYPKARFIFLPHKAVLLAVLCQEMFLESLRFNPILKNYQIIPFQKAIQYNTTKLHRDLHWQPKYAYWDRVGCILQNERF
jgi:hypothetical protein